MSADFGEYYSHFGLEPLLEFGETRGAIVGADNAFGEYLDVGLFLIDSHVN